MTVDPFLLAPGTLESTALTRLVAAGHVTSVAGVLPTQIQPASLDLTLGTEAYRMPGSILPIAGESVRALVTSLALERIDLSKPACLGRDQVYVVPLRERLQLPPGLEAYANGKSSTGRIDLAPRVLSDVSPRYARILDSYHG